MEQQTPAADRNWRQYFSKLKTPSQFSKPQLALFILAFALIGYLIYHTFAAAPLIASVQGEQMTPQLASATGANSSISESGSAQVVLASSTTFSNLTKPTLSGSPIVGSTVKVNPGTWSPVPTSYSYAWWRCDSSGNNCIHSPTAPPASQNYYVVLSSDVGYTIRVQVAPNGSWTQSVSTVPSAAVTAATVTKTFGRTAIGGSWTGGLNANDRFVQKFSLSDNAQVSKLTYYVKGDGTASQVAKAIIYADSSGSPTALMGQGSEVTVRGGQAAGWVSFPFANTISLTPGNYWIGLIRGDTASTIDVATDKSGGTEAFAPDTYSDGAMNPFGTVKGTSTYSLSGYATYTVGSSTSTSPTKIVSDSTASNGQEMELLNNDTLASSFNLPSTAASITVMAKADLCSGVGAAMTASVDGAQLINTTVNATSLTAYSANTNLAAGTHTLTISYTNDTSASTCDRNLYVDVTNFFGPNVSPAPTVSLSVSPSSITSGQSATLTWSSTNASSCTASGAWSGSKATSGSLSTGALSQTSTYTLTCTGSGGTATAGTTVTVTSVTTGQIPGVGTLDWGSNYSYQTNLNKYAVLGLSGGSESKASLYPNQTTIGYVSAAATESYWVGVNNTDAAANDWYLHCADGSLIHNQVYTSEMLLDPAYASYQSAFVSQTQNFISKYGLKGVFIDEFNSDASARHPLCASGVKANYPFYNKAGQVVIADPAAWQAAMLSWIKTVGSALKSHGDYVEVNGAAGGTVTGWDDTGAKTKAWMASYAPYVSNAAVEYWMEGNTTYLRSNGTSAWYKNWDTWEALAEYVQGLGIDFSGVEHYPSGSCTNMQWQRYTRASFLLAWSGKAHSTWQTMGNRCNTWTSVTAYNPGLPTGARTHAAAGVWQRNFQNGTVVINTNATPVTVSVNSKSYTIGATDALLL
jgi:hypothetical protein